MIATALFMRLLIFLSVFYHYFQAFTQKNVDIFGVNLLLTNIKM